MQHFIDANRSNWDDRVPVHLESKFYDLASFKAGRSSLLAIERERVGDVRGKTLLHLQCHFGQDTLSWAREGAVVTGVDFSSAAIAAARALAAELGLTARFIETDVYKLPAVLNETFDVVFASYGVLWWLPDLPAWMGIAARYLRPGGVFHLIDGHPFEGMLEWGSAEPRLGRDYFRTAAYEDDDDKTYTDQSRPLQHGRSFGFQHTLGAIVTSAVDAGLRIESLQEYPYAMSATLPGMQRGPDGYFRVEGNETVPFLFALKATKPA